MHTQRVVMTSMFLVLFGSTIFQSCQSAGKSEAIYDMQFDAISFGTTIATQHQNVTYEGDLFVNNNETFTIQDSEFHLILGKIIVQDTSTLIIQNSTFSGIPPEGSESIVLEDQAKLIVENATMISGFRCKIVVRNHADLCINRSALQKTWEVLSFDEAEIHVNNSTITAGDIYHNSGIGTYGTISVTIENSDIDGVWVWGNSTVSIKNSVIGLVRAGGVTDVNITDSKIRTIDTGGWSREFRAPSIIVQNSTVTWGAQLSFDSSVRFTKSSVGNIEAHGNASIMLIDCHAGRIETHDDATVFVGRHLPLFGLVTMHYTLVPIIQTIITITVIVTIITVSVFLFRKRARHRQREPTGASEAKKIYLTIVYP